MADKLFGGQRAWFWSIPVLAYGALFSSNYDTPPIYNSVHSCYLFQIDLRPGALLVRNWVCIANSCWVMCSLLILYSCLLYKMRGYQNRIEKRSYKEMQRKVMLQSFWICFCVFLVAGAYAAAGFIRIPNKLGKCATMALQFCSGSTSIVYLALNKTIRRGVKDLLTGKKRHVSPTTDLEPAFDQRINTALFGGVAQIKVTFDVDANGILNVSAQDKLTGLELKLTQIPGNMLGNPGNMLGNPGNMPGKSPLNRDSNSYNFYRD
ncbi:serpentine type 7TM GPCR chemoreceptor srt domain-containing protein [Ditylenchus destructor]|nr:serpentine type 7TM GPCR chemoreceptor srt domain-containing protein [Ditylenchus destructor]